MFRSFGPVPGLAQVLFRVRSLSASCKAIRSLFRPDLTTRKKKKRVRSDIDFQVHFEAGGAKLEKCEKVSEGMKDNKRAVGEYKFQKLPEKVTVWSDADPTGCRHTRRST